MNANVAMKTIHPATHNPPAQTHGATERSAEDPGFGDARRAHETCDSMHFDRERFIRRSERRR